VRNDYVELETVQLKHCEVIVSRHDRGGRTVLALAPRKTFMDRDSQQLKAFIPKRSSIEFSSLAELDDFLEVLFRLRNESILKDNNT
jgi:hypothetical protein